MKKLIIANWKMNPRSWKEAKRLFNAFKKLKAVICPPFVYISKFKIQNSKLQLGAQNCHWEQSGAYTGEISPLMLRDLGCKYVIVGHSERRKHFRETDEMINKKLKAALKAGLRPILCIGENKNQDAKRVVNNQLKKDLKGIAEKDLKKIIIAYEPIWAISTSGGEYCSPERAKRIMDFIRADFKNKVIYGGSVDSKTIKGYIDAGFEGALVGGASLKAEEFIKIVKNA